MTNLLKAKPKKCDYRERYVNHKITVQDILAPQKYNERILKDPYMDNFSYKGENLTLGSGVEQDF